MTKNLIIQLVLIAAVSCILAAVSCIQAVLLQAILAAFGYHLSFWLCLALAICGFITLGCTRDP